jgi:hypothetical protein
LPAVPEDVVSPDTPGMPGIAGKRARWPQPFRPVLNNNISVSADAELSRNAPPDKIKDLSCENSRKARSTRFSARTILLRLKSEFPGEPKGTR